MSDVKRFWTELGPQSGLGLRTEVVLAADYDALVAELEALNDEIIDHRNYTKACRERDAVQKAHVDKLEAELQALKAARQWIPVGERLPDECRANVLLYFKESHAITIGLWSDVFHTWEFHHHVDFDDDQLTHWMPLPAAPQEDKSHD